MLILPRDLLQIPRRSINSDGPHIHIICQSEGLSVLTKHISSPIYERTGYLATHAVSFVINGEQHIETYEGTYLRVQAGSAVLLPRDLYQISDLVPKRGQFESLLIYFDSPTQLLPARFFDDKGHLAPKEAKSHSALPFVFSLNQNMKSVLEEISSSTSTLQTTGLIEEMFTLQSKQKETFASKFTSIGVQKKRSLRPFVETHATKALKVEDFAYLTGRSLSSFRREFKASFGQSPSQWLRDKRLEYAHELMSRKDERVSDLAHAAGYENVSYFIRAFRKKYGESPKQMMMAKGTSR